MTMKPLLIAAVAACVASVRRLQLSQTRASRGHNLHRRQHHYRH